MMEQMELFNEGGLRDEGGAVEPESGNEVPSGALKKEVADDIPVMISEGEFVFPADVVRYIGLETLMKMRQDAKQGLKMMEKMGQMGNSEESTIPDDIPFGMADLIVVSGEMKKKDKEEKAEGGVIGLQTGGSLFDDPRFQRSEGGDDTPVLDDDDKKEIEDALLGTVYGTVTMRRYVNADGVVKYIPFIDGEPQMPIPEGFELDDTAPEPKSSVVTSTGDTGGGEDSGGTAFTPDVGSSFDDQGTASFNINNLNNEDLVEYYGSFSSPMNRFLTVGVGALFGGVPALGIAAMQQLAQTRGPNSLVAVENLLAQKISNGEISGDLLDRLKELQERAKQKGTGPKGFLASLIGKVSKGDETKKTNLENAIANGDVSGVDNEITDVDRSEFKVIDVSPVASDISPEEEGAEIIPEPIKNYMTYEGFVEGTIDGVGGRMLPVERPQTLGVPPSTVEPTQVDLMDPAFDSLEMEIDKSSEIGTPAYSLKGSPYETEGREQLGTPTKDMPLKGRTKKRTRKADTLDDAIAQSETDTILRRGEKLPDTPSLFPQTRVDDFLMGVQRDDEGNVSNLTDEQQQAIAEQSERVRDRTEKAYSDPSLSLRERERIIHGFDVYGGDTPSRGSAGQDNIGGVSSPAPDITQPIMANEGGLTSAKNLYVGGVPTKPMKPQRLKKGGLAKPKVKPKRMKKGGLASRKK